MRLAIMAMSTMTITAKPSQRRLFRVEVPGDFASGLLRCIDIHTSFFASTSFTAHELHRKTGVEIRLHACGGRKRLLPAWAGGGRPVAGRCKLVVCHRHAPGA